MNQPTMLRPNLIPPQGNPFAGGQRRLVRTEPLFRNVGTSGPGYGVNTADFEVWNPSTRLYVCMTVGFLPDSQEDATIPAGWTLSLDAWAKTQNGGLGGGRRVRGNSIIPGPFSLANQLPLSYEAVTGVDQWRGRVTIPASGTGLATTGYLVAAVSWEPAPGESSMSDQELARIFDACKLTPGNGAGGTVFATVIP